MITTRGILVVVRGRARAGRGDRSGQAGHGLTSPPAASVGFVNPRGSPKTFSCSHPNEIQLRARGTQSKCVKDSGIDHPTDCLSLPPLPLHAPASSSAPPPSPPPFPQAASLLALPLPLPPPASQIILPSSLFFLPLYLCVSSFSVLTPNHYLSLPLSPPSLALNHPNGR